MKAVTYDQFGPPEVLRLRDIPAPSPRRGYVRVQVHAAALNPKDVLVRKGKMRWLVGGRLPRIPGYDIAGILLDDSGDLRSGDEVYGMIGSHQGGGCAEIVSLPADEIAQKPAQLTMVEAASLPLAGLTALQGLRDELRVQAGQRVLLNGASGGVGTLAVQMAHALNTEVIGVCSERNREMVIDLGAHAVVDYRTQSLHTLRDLDAIYDIFGNFTWPEAKYCLKPQGRYCTTVPSLGAIARGALQKLSLHRAALVVVKSKRADLDTLRIWVEAGKLSPVVDTVVSLERSAEAHTYLETRRARGKVVVEVVNSN